MEDLLMSDSLERERVFAVFLREGNVQAGSMNR